MADPLGYIKNRREEAPRKPAGDPPSGFGEDDASLSRTRLEIQAGRCIDCGAPFCEIQGCPAHNRIPDWIGMVYSGKWRTALDMLHATNNFPEITGRVCPAYCEPACILSIGHEPVTIRQIELRIAERGWAEGWIAPETGTLRTGRRVAVIGSGPAGLAAAQQLNRSGHAVTVYERDDRIGGILRYGIPDFVLDKKILDRRIGQLAAEGVSFETRVDVGVDLSIGYLKRSFDLTLVIIGSRQPRDLVIPGRELTGIVPAMEFLTLQNRAVAGEFSPDESPFFARGRNVAVIGGGEIGNCCVETCRRQGAAGLTLVEISPSGRDSDNIALSWPLGDAHSERPGHPDGCGIFRGMTVDRFVGDGGSVSGCILSGTGTEPAGEGEQLLKADMVILALDSPRVESGPLIRNLELETDERGNIRVDADYRTTSPGIFAAGSCVLGDSPIVRAIAEGRKAAAAVNRYLS